MKRLLFTTMTVAALTGSASAQSRSELQVQGLNQQLRQRTEQIQQNMVTQFELNQLRMETQRNFNAQLGVPRY